MSETDPLVFCPQCGQSVLLPPGDFEGFTVKWTCEVCGLHVKLLIDAA